jgi:uncharacterized integral membrane protein
VKRPMRDRLRLRLASLRSYPAVVLHMRSDREAADQPGSRDNQPAGTGPPAGQPFPEDVAAEPAPVPADPATTRPTASSAIAGGSDASRPAGPVPRTRIGGLWVAAIVATLVGLFLLIFILQNGQSVTVSFLGFDGQLPLGVALLLAAACGALLVAIPGTGRILQLRRRAHRRSKDDTEMMAPRPNDR